MGENENLKFYPSKVITSLSDDPTDNLAMAQGYTE